jgi:ABC-type multidrug transport system fused ATPase/permease subunit
MITRRAASSGLRLLRASRGGGRFIVSPAKSGALLLLVGGGCGLASSSSLLLQCEEATTIIPLAAAAAPLQYHRPQTHTALLLSLLSPWDWVLYLTSATCSVLVSLTGTMQAKLIGSVFDALGNGGDAATGALLRLLSMFVLHSALGFASSVSLSSATTRLGEKLRVCFFEAVLAQDMDFFDDAKTGELAHQLSHDVGALQTAVRESFTRGVEGVTTLVAGAALLYSTSPTVALAMFTVLPLGAVAGSVFGNLLRNLSQEARKAANRATGIASESMQGIHTVRSFAAEEVVVRAYEKELRRGSKLKQDMALATGAFYAAVQLGINLTTILLCGVGNHLVQTKKLTRGDLAAIATQVQLLERALARLTQLSSQISTALKSSEHIVHIIAHAPLVNTVNTGGRVLSKISGSIELRNVRFAYPTRKDAVVLDNLNLVAEPGQVVALVGASGSGKSTIAQLIERFYDVDQGSVRVDGVDIRDLDPQFLRRSIGYVSQHPDLFSGTIRENIRFGCGKPVSDEAIEQAAMKAHAHAFIMAMPQGYDTVLGEGGAQLSGGQRQRLAIARTLLLDPRILLLDEITSGLDAESEFWVQKALDELMVGRTSIVIAHRLVTVMNASQIYVLEDGAVVEHGSHKELVGKPDGVYRAFFERQSRLRRRQSSAK